MNKLSALTLRYLKTNLSRTLTTIVGIIMSAAIIYIIFAGGYSGYKAFSRKAYEDTLGWDAAYVCSKEDARRIAEGAASDDSIANAFFVGMFNGFMQYVSDFNAMPVPIKLNKGALPTNENEIICSTTKSFSFKRRLGSSFSVVQDEEKEISGEYTEEDLTYLKTVGLFDDGFMMSDNMTENGFRTDAYTTVMTNDSFDATVDDVTLYICFADKSDIKNQAYDFAHKNGFEHTYINNTAIDYYGNHPGNNSVIYLAFNAMLLVLAAVSAMLCLIIIRNAFNIAVNERNQDYGILRCVGMSRRQIVKIILLECIIVAGVGILLGIILGHTIVSIGFAIVRKTMQYPAYFKVGVYGRAIGMSVIYSLVSTGYAMISPIQKLYKLNPVEALRKNAEYKLGKANPRRGRFLSGLFGFEAGYAYKSAMRYSGRYVIMIVTLGVGIMLFTGVCNGVKGIENGLEFYRYEYISDGCFVVDDYAGAIELKQELMECGEIKTAAIRNDATASCVVKGEDGNDYTKDLYIGVEREVFDALLDASGGKLTDGFVNLIKINSEDDIYMQHMLNDKAGELIVKDTTGEYKLRLCGQIEYEDYCDILEQYRMISLSNWEIGQYIFCLGDMVPDFDNLVEPYTNGLNDYKVELKLKDNYDEERFSEFIFNSEYVFQSDISELRQLKSKNNTVKSIVMIIAAMFFLVFVSNCLNVNRADSILRRNEFEIMSTLGMSRKQEKKIHFYENFIAAGLATIIGCIVGVIVGWAFAFVAFAGETGVRVNEVIDWRSILITVISMMLFVMVTTFFAPKTDKI